jgi:hypothetical protein
MLRWLPIVLVCAAPLLLADKYSGPRPPKPDVPYLMHADDLIPTESGDAKQEERKGEVTYAIPGANSPVRTPLASPAFLIRTEELQADKIQLFKLQSKGGQREITIRRRNKLVARPLRLNVTRLDDNLYKLEVDEILENGEYSLTPADSNQVFCFQIY